MIHVVHALVIIYGLGVLIAGSVQFYGWWMMGRMARAHGRARVQMTRTDPDGTVRELSTRERMAAWFWACLGIVAWPIIYPYLAWSVWRKITTVTLTMPDMDRMMEQVRAFEEFEQLRAVRQKLVALGVHDDNEILKRIFELNLQLDRLWPELSKEAQERILADEAVTPSDSATAWSASTRSN